MSQMEPALDQPLRYVKGVGEYLSKLFAKKDVEKIYDALYFFPRTYEDRRELLPVSKVVMGKHICVFGRIRRAHPVFYSRSRRRAFEVVLEDPADLSHINLTFFHAPYFKSKLVKGLYLIAMGEAKSFRGNRRPPRLSHSRACYS